MLHSNSPIKILLEPYNVILGMKITPTERRGGGCCLQTFIICIHEAIRKLTSDPRTISQPFFLLSWCWWWWGAQKAFREEFSKSPTFECQILVCLRGCNNSRRATGWMLILRKSYVILQAISSVFLWVTTPVPPPQLCCQLGPTSRQPQPRDCQSPGRGNSYLSIIM